MDRTNGSRDRQDWRTPGDFHQGRRSSSPPPTSPSDLRACFLVSVLARACGQTCASACTHVFARRYACAYLCLFLHTRQSTHTHKHKHTYAHTHTHAHAHARTTSRLLSLPPSVSFQTPSLPNTQATVRIFRLQEPGHGKRPVVLRSVSERITLGTQLQTPLQRQRSNLGIETYT